MFPMVTFSSLLAAWTACLSIAPSAAMPNMPTVTHDSGSVVGVRLDSAGIREGSPAQQYAAFWGVPFAEPPVGALRFKPPVRVGFPVGRLQATNSRFLPCLQQRRDPARIEGSEDCLSLHIFTPYLDAPDLPVVVFFHGGAFMYGSAPRDGERYLMDYDVVVVTVEYRLGILGFLSFDDETMPGNLGMLDQVAALQWIQENIQHFGGNNRSITIAGLSAGSASCLLHTLSPLSRGLFHRVIGASGSPLNPWTQQHSPRRNALRVAALANCSANSTEAVLECLRTKDAAELAALEADHFQFWQQNPFSPFAPVVDRRASSPFLPEDPQKMISSGNGIADVPLLLSLTTDEGLYNSGEFISNSSLLQELDAAWETVAPLLLHFHDSRVPENVKSSWSESIREHYLRNSSLSDNVHELVQLMGDRNFVVGVAEHAIARATTQSSPVYFYRFGYRGQYSLYNDVHAGVSHADDVQYVLVFPRWSGTFSTPGDLLVQKRLLETWTSFITNGTPTVQGLTWPPMPKNSRSLHYLFVRGPSNMTMVETEDIGHGLFWKRLDDSINSDSSASIGGATSILVSILSICLVITNCAW